MRLTVLVVDDEPPVLESTAAILSEDFEVLTAAGGGEALELLGRHAVHVVCTDYNMPGMTGLELLREVARAYPLISGVIVSGFREYWDGRKRTERDPIHLVLKPYKPQQLIEQVERAGSAAKLRMQLSGVTAKLGATRGTS